MSVTIPFQHYLENALEHKCTDGYDSDFYIESNYAWVLIHMYM